MFILIITTVIAATFIEKIINHTHRVTRYYVTRRKGNKLIISHEPLGWYRQRKESFFKDRATAYELIAQSLPNHIQSVHSASVWIDFDREGWTVVEKGNTPIKRLTAVWFYWANIENWNREPGTSWYVIGNPMYRAASMTREEFVARFGRGEVS
jgi:hypothetical protein